MNSWNMLFIMCCASPLCGALVVARDQTANAGGYAVAVACGLILGAGSVWILRSVHARGISFADKVSSGSTQEWLHRAPFAVEFVWWISSVMLGMKAYATLMRLAP